MCAKCYEIRRMFKKIAARQIWRVCACISVKIRVFFGIRFERRKFDKKRKPTQKMKHANFIPEYLEHFCQMAS